MVMIELTKGQIEHLISTMETLYYWNTDNPTLDSDYNQKVILALEKGLVSTTESTNKSRFEDIIG